MPPPAPPGNSSLSLPANVLKNLGDKLYEKRKSAALDIEQMVRKLLVSKQRNDICFLIQKLAGDFARSPHANQRKGALLGLAAVACGLTNQHIREFLPLMMPPVLESITDQDTRVRFYAVESLYNIADIARGAMAPFLLQAFDGLFRVSADADDHLRYAVPFAENLLKDIACNSSPDLDATSFINQIALRMESVKPYNRRFILGWIEALASSTSVDMLVFLPDILDGLFAMLSDAVSVLVLRSEAGVAAGGGGLAADRTAVASGSSADASPAAAGATSASKQSSVTLTTVSLGGGSVVPRNASFTNGADWQPQEVRNMASGVLAQLLGIICSEQGGGGGGDVNYAALVEHVLVPRAQDPEPRICITALVWLQAFIRLADLGVALEDADEGAALVRRQLLPQVHAIIGALLHSTRSSATDRARALADGIAREMFRLRDKQSWDHIAMGDVLRTITNQGLEDPEEPARLMALEWINFLLHIDQAEVLPQVDQLLPVLFNVMVGSSDQVVHESLAVQASFAASTDSHFGQYVSRLVAAFQAPQGAELLQRRGSMVLRRLCALLEPKRLFLALAERLEDQPSLKFAATMVQALNLLLLTAPEAKGLRQMLQDCNASPEGRRLFLVLYRSWCHAPGAVLTLCLLARAYEHAATLVNTFGESVWDMDVLVQLDRVVRMLESPVFTFLRLHLLQPTVHPALMRALYGLLMILPQGEAFKTLSARLNALPMAALMQIGGGGGEAINSAAAPPWSSGAAASSKQSKGCRDKAAAAAAGAADVQQEQIDFSALLNHFLELQAKHVAAEQLRQAQADKFNQQTDAETHSPRVLEHPLAPYANMGRQRNERSSNGSVIFNY